MKNTARRPEPEVTFGTLLRAGATGVGMAIVRNPLAVGAVTAFAVAFSFVSANALWYQPHFHSGALISTRTPVFTEPRSMSTPSQPARLEETPRQAPRQVAPDRDTTGAIPVENPQDVAGGDPTIRQVQSVLRDLGLYRGTIDGLEGPETRTAIENYRRIVDLDPTPTVDEALLRQLGLSATPQPAETTSNLSVTPTSVPPVAPTPTPRPAYQRSATAPVNVQPAAERVPIPTAEVPQARVQTAALETTEADPTIMRVQAGLKAFGNDGIEVDGLLGENTQAAIREFQSLFGLPVTGQPDQTLLAKMREVGLTN
ncbi:peptidoglycan-binding protein [Nitratireductor kimnyeongensis]|uniref:Peptidoglycan-binding protein n=1 Tax=Nitratireductor kimnyeongensis TaxID=430679 RepID=A0ABW0T6C1_9HYPH|nr:peptidoglycan-binding protein [Nitratireductor kimnyeongensis]QZZ34995.1 peptidoglycan-binding protein [Nitratireductor kimnyeongensis]